MNEMDPFIIVVCVLLPSGVYLVALHRFRSKMRLLTKEAST